MTVSAPLSPWRNLPTKPKYILPEDLDFIQKHHNFPHLRLDMLPGQFAGGLDKAEIVFLALNPGFDERDTGVDLALPGFPEAILENQNDPFGSPFYYFNSGFEQTAGYEWWAKKLKPLMQAGVTDESLREKVMLVEYFPYHSRIWKSLPLIPSQQFAFDLVAEAVARKKIIVIMRKEKLWLEAVEGLRDYDYMRVNSWLNPTISPNNLGEENFRAILSKLI